MLKPCLWIPVSLSLAACSLNKSLNETQNATNEMKGYTKNLKEYSTHLAKRTDDLERELTFKESSWMMEQNLRWLWGEEKLPSTADSQPYDEPDLPFYASYVIESMWFQFWKGDYRENRDSLDDRLEHGARVLLTRVMTHTPHEANVDQLIPNRSWKGVGALGARMDQITRHYEKVWNELGGKPVSFYDLVIMALQVRDQVRPVTPYPKAVSAVLQYQQLAEHLLQLRHNYLPVMVLSFITDFKDRSVIGRGEMALVKTSVDLNRFNPSQLTEWTVWLQKTLRTRDDLRALGVPPVLNAGVHRVLANVDFGQSELLARPAADEIGRLRREFAKAYLDVIEKGTTPHGTIQTGGGGTPEYRSGTVR